MDDWADDVIKIFTVPKRKRLFMDERGLLSNEELMERTTSILFLIACFLLLIATTLLAHMDFHQAAKVNSSFTKETYTLTSQLMNPFHPPKALKSSLGILCLRTMFSQFFSVHQLGNPQDILPMLMTKEFTSFTLTEKKIQVGLLTHGPPNSRTC